MEVHYILRLTPAWPKFVQLADPILGNTCVHLQMKVFEHFGDVSVAVSGHPIDQMRALAKMLDLPVDESISLGENPFISVRPNSTVFLFDSPAYLDESSVVKAMDALVRDSDCAYHLHSGNGRPLQVYALSGSNAASFHINKSQPLTVPGIFPMSSITELHSFRDFVRSSIIMRHVENGVVIANPETVRIDQNVTIGEGTVVESGSVIKGHSSIGMNCHIGPNSIIDNCKLGDGCTVNSSQVVLSTLDSGVRVGPFANIRAGCHIGKGSLVGTAVELKNVRVGENTDIPHLSFIGDAEVGDHVNIGCGCATASFNGVSKQKTQIEDNAFIGCNSVLVAPVNVGEGSIVGAGSVVSNDVPPYALAVARARQVNKEDWARDRDRNW